MICKNCDKDVDRDEVARVFGDFLAERGCCSATCFTDHIATQHTGDSDDSETHKTED